MAPKNTRFTVIKNFAKGLVTARPPASLEPGEAQVADNVELENGVVHRRDGWRPLTATLPSGTEPVNALYSHYETDKNARLFAVAGTYLMYTEGSSFNTVSSTLTPSSPAYATFKATQDILYIATAYGKSRAPQALKKWTEAGGLVNVAGSPSGSIITSFNDALWLAGGSGTNDSRVWWSRAYPNQDTWPSLNFFDVFPGDGDRVTGLGRHLNALIVFKERSIHRVTGTQADDSSLETGSLNVTHIEDQPGCVAPGSVASGYNLVVYLNRTGIYAYDGVRAVELTENIRPLFDTLNENQLQNAVGRFIAPYHYVLSVTSEDSTTPDLVISLRLQPTRSVTLWKGLSVSAWETFRFDGITVPVLGLPGFVGRMDATTDNGKAIDWTYTTGSLDFGEAPVGQTLRRGWLRATPTGAGFTVTLLPDFATVGPTFDVMLTQSGVDAGKTVRVPLPGFGTARHWAMRLSGKVAAPPSDIHEVVFEHYPRSFR